MSTKNTTEQGNFPLANVSIMAFVPTWFVSSKRGRASGFVVIGSGFAIMLSGKLIPFLNNLHDNGWRMLVRSWSAGPCRCPHLLPDHLQQAGRQRASSIRG